MNKYKITHEKISPKTVKAESKLEAMTIATHLLTPAEKQKVGDFDFGFGAEIKLIKEDE